MAFGFRRAKMLGNCPCRYLPRFPTYVVMIHQCYGQMDRQNMQSQYRALRYSASHGKNDSWMQITSIFCLFVEVTECFSN